MDVIDDSDIEDAYEIRRKAVAALRALRGNDLTRDFQARGLNKAELGNPRPVGVVGRQDQAKVVRICLAC